MSVEPTVGEMVDLFETNGMVEITTEKQYKRGSISFMDLEATKKTGKAVQYIFNVRSGFAYRKVGTSSAYPINRRDSYGYDREFNRVRQMNKIWHLVEGYRERPSRATKDNLHFGGIEITWK